MLSQMAMDMKVILQKSYYAQKLLDADIDKRMEIRLLMEKITPTLSDMPKSYGDPDKLGAALVRLEALDSKIADDIYNLTGLLTVNRMLIDSVDNYNQRIVLTKRYVNFQRWEQIAIDIPCGWNTVHRWHREALEYLAKHSTRFCSK